MSIIHSVRYEAEDGELFDSKEECDQYERFVLHTNRDLIMLDANLNETDLLDSAFYILAKTDEAARYAAEKSKYFGANLPFENCPELAKKGCYFYINEPGNYGKGKEVWVSYEEIQRRIVEITNKLYSL